MATARKTSIWLNLVVFVAISGIFIIPRAGVAGTSADAIDAVTKDIQAVCTQPATQGEHWKITGDATAEAGINLKLLKVPSIKGSLHFSKDEWKGVQQVLSADQARDNESYRQCARELAPKFLEKIPPPPRTTLNCSRSNCAGINTGEQNFYYGNAPPPARVITPEDAAAAVNALQTAVPQSKVFLVYSGKNGLQEIEEFFGQVSAIFHRADHWQIVGTERIGPQMLTMDGSILTGEGVGCSIPGSLRNAGEIAKTALALTGHPCTREAANWGPHTYDERGARKPEIADIVISIGSRFIPPS